MGNLHLRFDEGRVGRVTRRLLSYSTPRGTTEFKLSNTKTFYEGKRCNRLPGLPPVGRPSGNGGASDGHKPKHIMKEKQGGRGPQSASRWSARNSKIQSRKETLAAGRFAPASRLILQ